ncbi:MAG: hypothetical protein ACRD0H_22235, partial [Actinomycetes bacterium]
HGSDPRKQGSDGVAAVPALTGQTARTAAAVEAAVAPLFGQLPQMIGQALYQVLSQVPVQTVRLNCAECVLARLRWTTAHDADLKVAYEKYAAAMAELPEQDPRRQMLTPVVFLPPHLQPSPDQAEPNPEGLPGIAAGDVMVGGTLYCAEHMPGAPSKASKRPFLIAQGALTPGLLAELTGQAA